MKASQPLPASDPSRKSRRQRKAQRRKKATRSREATGPRRPARARSKPQLTTAAEPAKAAAATRVERETPELATTPSEAAAPADFELEFVDFTGLESEFFDSVPPLPAATHAVAPFLGEEEDPDLAPLTPEQLGRRLKLRRQVTRLMAALGTFGAVACAVRVAALL